MKIISFLFYCFPFFTLFSGSVIAQVNEKDINTFLNDSAVRTGHAGISIYEPATGKYLYEYNADKNFTPSSNVKLFTLYAGLKYLGDSLAGIRYRVLSGSTLLYPTGDPTFLHEDFKLQPVAAFMKNKYPIYLELNKKDRFKQYGPGWAWDDYNEVFMTERSVFPYHGNTIKVMRSKDSSFTSFPVIGHNANIVGMSEEDYDFKTNPDVFRPNMYANTIFVNKDKFKPGTSVTIPFTNRQNATMFDRNDLSLYDTLHITLSSDYGGLSTTYLHKTSDSSAPIKIIHSRPVDSLFRPMMFNSDNFFAEQTLLMVSNERLGYMSDEAIIDTLLKTDLKDIPTKPRWVDGSGLSRYNLFSPKDFIYILDKLQKEFGMDRMKRILPTGGQGTLTNYYEKEAGFIYAKTGSMSNNVSLSGYLFTRKNKMLLFSVIINNYTGSGRSGRQAIEKLLRRVRETN